MSAAAPRLSTAAWALLRRDLTLALRRQGELLNPLLFFILVVSLFPFAVGPDSNILRLIGPGIIWVAALLASLLSLDSMFRSDFDDGALEQIALSPHPLSVLVMVKVCAHWLVSGLPLLLLAPLLGVLFQMSAPATGVLMLSLALGTPVLSLVGAVGVALTVGLRRGGMLLTLLLLPLYVPVLIFGAGAVNDMAAGLSVAGPLAFLGALLALALSLTPMATAAALRISLG